MKNFGQRQKNKKGFTLVEIMAATAIIGLLTAMSMPHFLRMRVDANESTAQANLSALHEMTEDFRFVSGFYPMNRAGIEQFVSTTYGSNSIISNPNGASPSSYYTFQGYRYDYRRTRWSGGEVHGYQWAAMPDVPAITGNRYFAVDEAGTLSEISVADAAGWFPGSCPRCGEQAGIDVDNDDDDDALPDDGPVIPDEFQGLFF